MKSKQSLCFILYFVTLQSVMLIAPPEGEGYKAEDTRQDRSGQKESEQELEKRIKEEKDIRKKDGQGRVKVSQLSKETKQVIVKIHQDRGVTLNLDSSEGQKMTISSEMLDKAHDLQRAAQKGEEALKDVLKEFTDEFKSTRNKGSSFLYGGKAKSQVIVEDLMDGKVSERGVDNKLNELTAELGKGGRGMEKRVENIIRVLNQDPTNPMAQKIYKHLDTLELKDNIGIHFDEKGQFQLITDKAYYDKAMKDLEGELKVNLNNTI